MTRLARLIASAFSGSGGGGLATTARVRNATDTYLGVAEGNGFWLETIIPNVTAGGTYSLTPDATPKLTIPVTSQGYNSSGTLTTIARTVIGAAPIQQSYPNNPAIIEVQSGSNVSTNIALNEYIYDADTVGTGTLLANAYTSSPAASITVTNDSTLVYPQVMADWVLPPKREWTSDLTLEVVAKHKFGRNGSPVACVRITGFDGTNTVSKICTYGLSTYGDNLEVYRATFNVSEFISGNDVLFNFEAMPWVGDGSAVRSTVGGTFPSVTTTCGQVYRCGAIPDLRFAYVLTTGNDGTGVVQTTRAGAKATPYLTIGAALAALFAAKSDLSGCRLYIGAGTFDWPSANPAGATRVAPNAWFTIEGDPDDVNPIANCIIQTVGTTYVQVFNNAASTMAWLAMTKLTVNIRPAMQGLFNANNTRATLWMDDMNLNVQLTNTTTWCSSTVNYFTKVNGQAPNQTARIMQFNAANLRPHLIRNCTTNRGLQANINVSSTMSVTSSGVSLGDGTNGRVDNLLLVNFRLLDYSGSASALNFVLNTANQTFQNQAVSNCLFVGDASNIQPLAAFGENVTTDQDNILIEYITTAGGLNQTCMRLNIHNDPIAFPTTTLSEQSTYKDFALTNSLLQWLAVKDDIFSGANEGNTGANLVIQGWDKAYGVGWRDVNSAFTPDDFFPRYAGIGSSRAVARTFAPSTYRPTSGFPTCEIQSLSFDIDGNARRQDGTGAGGALES